jgi:hypothetical protein
MEVIRRTLALMVATFTVFSGSAAGASPQDPTIVVGPGGGTPGTSSNLALVGHEPLFGRGMNAALTFYSHYAYVGNRTDGSNSCGDFNATGPVAAVLTPTNPDGTCTHVHPGILVVDVANPSAPSVVGEFGTEFVTGAEVGQTSRELRVWPQQGLLMVMYFRCSRIIHACPRSVQHFSIRLFDLWANPLNPPLIATYTPAALPHEMYLWIDPKNSERALLWISTPSVSASPNAINLIIADISHARQGVVPEIARGTWNQYFPGADNPANYDFDLALHSMAPTVDGTKTYLAHLRGGIGILDTSAVAAGQIPPGTVLNLNNSLLTPVPFPTWGTGSRCPGHTALGCGESHSAIPFPGRPFALTIDEVYGTFTTSSFGWPWGWDRIWNVANPAKPRLMSQYQIAQNSPTFQGSPGDDPATEQFTSYSAHNPTLTHDLAIDAWHSGGLQIIDVSDPGAPAQAGWYSPNPLASVAVEDPALNRGPNKVTIWSYPVIRNGLIYVIDIRNGLYIFTYTGTHAQQVTSISYLEGNSNLGDACCLKE